MAKFKTKLVSLLLVLTLVCGSCIISTKEVSAASRDIQIDSSVTKVVVTCHTILPIWGAPIYIKINGVTVAKTTFGWSANTKVTVNTGGRSGTLTVDCPKARSIWIDKIS